MLIAELFAAFLVVHAAGFVQGAAVSAGLCPPPPRVKPHARVLPRWPQQPERGNRRF